MAWVLVLVARLDCRCMSRSTVSRTQVRTSRSSGMRLQCRRRLVHLWCMWRSEAMTVSDTGLLGLLDLVRDW